MNIHARACVQSVHHQHAHMISDGHASIDDVAVMTWLFAPTVAACCCVFTLHILRTYLGFSHLCDVIFGYNESLQSALQVEVII